MEGRCLVEHSDTENSYRSRDDKHNFCRVSEANLGMFH